MLNATMRGLVLMALWTQILPAIELSPTVRGVRSGRMVTTGPWFRQYCQWVLGGGHEDRME